MPMHEPIIVQDDAGMWRDWLRTFAGLLAALLIACFGGVLLVDPFSTGRFALTQRIDRAPKDAFYWFAKAGIIRDRHFDAAIFGSSVAGTLDPAEIGEPAKRNVLQFALYGASPQNVLTALRSFERYRLGNHPLYIIILEQHWCSDTVDSGTRRVDDWLPEFPSWVYESSNYEYLSRIFSPFSIKTAIQRLGIWLGLRDNSIRADGFAPILPAHFDPDATARKLLSMKPQVDAPPPSAPFPNLDELSINIAMLDPRAPVLLAFVPVYINALPPSGSLAASRSTVCKQRVAAIAKKRSNTAFLDLQNDNPMARSVGDYFDEFHFSGNVARMVEGEIAKAAVDLQSAAE